MLNTHYYVVRCVGAYDVGGVDVSDVAVSDVDVRDEVEYVGVSDDGHEMDDGCVDVIGVDVYDDGCVYLLDGLFDVFFLQTLFFLIYIYFHKTILYKS